jgi:hypothetical protein
MMGFQELDADSSGPMVGAALGMYMVLLNVLWIRRIRHAGHVLAILWPVILVIALADHWRGTMLLDRGQRERFFFWGCGPWLACLWALFLLPEFWRKYFKRDGQETGA